MGIILAYDCTSEESFNNVRNWVRQIEVHASSNVEKILIGNKADLTDKKVIETEQGMALAKEFGMAFFETSARTGHNVNETFFHISKLIKDKQQKAAVVSGGGKTKEPTATSTQLESQNGTGKKKGKKGNDCCK
jgi:Ras-related protein Rab-8A